MCLLLWENYEFLGFIHRNLLPLFMPCLLNLWILAKLIFYRFPMILRVILYLEILGFEVLGSKIPFLKVLDCHDSPGRAITRHGKLDHQNRGSARPQLAIESNHSPPTCSNSPRRVDSVEMHCLLTLGSSGVFQDGFLVQSFYKRKPLKPRPQWIIF
jgi:hypothetical protein